MPMTDAPSLLQRSALGLWFLGLGALGLLRWWMRHARDAGSAATDPVMQVWWWGSLAIAVLASCGHLQTVELHAGLSADGRQVVIDETHHDSAGVRAGDRIEWVCRCPEGAEFTVENLHYAGALDPVTLEVDKATTEERRRQRPHGLPLFDRGPSFQAGEAEWYAKHSRG